MLHSLKIKPRKSWDSVAIEKLVKIYKDGLSRSHRVEHDLEEIEKHATIRKFKQRNFSINLGKKTLNCLEREAHQMVKRRAVDFVNTAYKISANKETPGLITDEDLDKIANGPKQCKKKIGRYNFTLPARKIPLGTNKKSEDLMELEVSADKYTSKSTP